MYKPEYYGGGDVDVFEKGKPITLTEVKIEFSLVGLDLITPEEAIGDIIENVVDLGFEGPAEEFLAGTLDRTMDFLTDENPNNNLAASGALRGFENQTKGHVNSGKMIQEDADAVAAMLPPNSRSVTYAWHVAECRPEG